MEMSTRIFCAIAMATVVLVVNASEVQKVTLDVKGMTCASCPVTVKVVLKQQVGVSEVKMDADQSTAEVRFDPAKVTPDRLARAVTEAGYPTTPRK
jgi:periplasmic mercuric ion binding protein